MYFGMFFCNCIHVHTHIQCNYVHESVCGAVLGLIQYPRWELCFPIIHVYVYTFVFFVFVIVYACTCIYI